ncbi:tyrosine-type recombinase/integrase [Vibrio brasiliensis]|uniref:tyrosine-type recombinase/integrase n=1 Tax=Vibrio brasiliensis TaxID=170652 RepID=UPI001EFD3CD5|nr:tyrosine-type recombinase/integrase [Vibrio brasiliensis]MCG9749136.1 tyrosine-type recombinase/integrase [Vibrio brasiliensis]
MSYSEVLQKSLREIRDFSNHQKVALSSISYADDAEVPEDKSKYSQQLMSKEVTRRSRFRDWQWDYREDASSVSINCRGSRLVIDFSTYTELPNSVINEIKCITYLYMLSPKLFIRKMRKRNRIKPNTLVKVTKDGLMFLNHVFGLLNAKYGKEFIQAKYYSLSKLERTHFEESARTYRNKFTKDCKIFLDNVSHTHARESVFGAIVQSESSEEFVWQEISGRKVRSNALKIIPDSTYERLVVYSSLVVTDFLQSQEITPTDKIALKHLRTEDHGLQFCSHWKIDKYVFDAYIALRMKNANYSYEEISKHVHSIEQNPILKGCNGIASHTTMDKRVQSLGVTFHQIQAHLSIVKFSCEYLIAQYTGMRPSELSEIPIDCLEEENGNFVLRSRVLKGKNLLVSKLFDDKWVVIPCVYDAVIALQKLNKIHQSEYLFSSTKTRKADSASKQVDSKLFKGHVDLLMRKFFGTSEPDGLKFNSYMVRHTLAYQLYKAELGLPYISFQLKHFVDRVQSHSERSLVNDVTIDYGGIGDLLAFGARGIREQAELDAVKSIMDPDGVYLGGKGSVHKERLKKSFQGYMEAGYSKDEVFRALAKQGVALINVGQGFCYGGAYEEWDETIPCIGSLRCNPIRCSNALVGKVNAPRWRDVYLTNKANLNNPAFASSHDQIKAAMEEAAAVLNYLGEDLLV